MFIDLSAPFVFCSVKKRTVEFPNGTIHHFDVTDAPPAVLALPFCSRTKTITLLRVHNHPHHHHHHPHHLLLLLLLLIMLMPVWCIGIYR